MKELADNEAGFHEGIWYLPYACVENHFNTLDIFTKKVVGNLFDRERQINAYNKINANHDGNSGEKVHYFIKKSSYK